MGYILSSGTDVVLQPFGSFVSNRNSNRFDVVNRLGTAILLYISEGRSVPELQAWLAKTNINRSDVEKFIGVFTSSGYLAEHHSAERVAPAGTVTFSSNPHVLKATRAEIEVTNRCNLRCIYCYAEVNKSKFELSTDEWVTTIKGMQEHGLRAVLLSGGEPFIRKDFVELVTWAAESLIIEINSNGYYITEEVARRLAPSNLKRIQISLDSVTPAYHNKLRGRGSHEAAVKAIKTLTKFDIPGQVSTVITQQNRDHLAEITAFAHSLGATFKADAVNRTGFAKDIPDQEWEANFKLPRRISVGSAGDRSDISHLLFSPLCQSQIGFVAVSHAGMLKPCNLRESFFEPTASVVLEAKESRWWERFYGEMGMGSAIGRAEAAGEDVRSAARKTFSRPLCELQLALIGSQRRNPDRTLVN